MVTDNRKYQKQPPRPISIFPVLLFFCVNPSDQLQAGPQPKSFRGNQGVHNQDDRYKIETAIVASQHHTRGAGTSRGHPRERASQIRRKQKPQTKPSPIRSQKKREETKRSRRGKPEDAVHHRQYARVGVKRKARRPKGRGAEGEGRRPGRDGEEAYEEISSNRGSAISTNRQIHGKQEEKDWEGYMAPRRR